MCTLLALASHQSLGHYQRSPPLRRVPLPPDLGGFEDAGVPFILHLQVYFSYFITASFDSSVVDHRRRR